MTLRVDDNGNRRWYFEGEFHREDGPAIENSDGSKSWYRHGKLHRVVLSGPAEDPSGVVTLGKFEGIPATADGEWHTVRFGLLDALRRKFPDDPRLVIWEPELANHSNRDYLLAGFSGNRAGATYWLRDISLGAPPERRAE